MRNQSEILNQIVLIERFNEFARLAKEYLGLDITPLNAGGCCFALAQYHIKHEREHTLDLFYDYINFITSHSDEQSMLNLLEKAKPRRSAAQSASLIHGGDNFNKASVQYNNFLIQGKPYQFRELMDFIQGISRAQVGYKSLIAKGRFAQDSGVSKGLFENIAGNFERSLPVFGNPRAIQAVLEDALVSEDQLALVSSGNHAIRYGKTSDGRYLVYDSNDAFRPKILTNLAEVAAKIVADFDKVGNVTRRNEVGFVIDTVSFSNGELELQRAIERYHDSQKEYGMHDSIAWACHKIIIDTNEQKSLNDKSLALHALYTQQVRQGLAQNINDFVKPFPPAMQAVIKESFNYIKKAAFADSVENRTSIDYQEEGMSPAHKAFMEKINYYYAQYHDGHLSRADFAVNVLRLIDQFMSTPEADSFKALGVYQRIHKLKNDLTFYSEGTISASELINSYHHVDLNQRDNTGFSLINHAFVQSPNKATLQALFDQGAAYGQYQFDPTNGVDLITLYECLITTNVDTVEYLASKIDLVDALMVPRSRGYELRLVFALPDKDPQKAEKNCIYLNSHGDYYVKDDQGVVQKGSLAGSGINLKNLARRLKDPALIAAVHVQTGQNGHTPKKLLLDDVIIFANSEVIKYLLNTLPNIDINRLTFDQPLLSIAVNNNSISLASELLAKGVKLTPSSASALLAKADANPLLKQFQEIKSKQDYSFNNYKADVIAECKKMKKPEPTEAQLRADWETVEAKQAALKNKIPVQEYTFEQFKSEYAQDFKGVSAWNAVVDEAIATGNEFNRARLLNASIDMGYLEVAEKILAHEGIDRPDQKTKQQEQRLKLFIKAVAAGNIEVVKRLVYQDPALVNALVNKWSASGLEIACEHRHSELALYLIKQGADVNAGSLQALYYALKAGDKEVIDQLIENGAKIDPKLSEQVRAPLMAIMASSMSTADKRKYIDKLYPDASIAEMHAKIIQQEFIAAAVLPTTTVQDIEMFAAKFNLDLSAIGYTLAMVSFGAGRFELADYFMDKTQLGPTYETPEGDSLFNVALSKITYEEFKQRTSDPTFNPTVLKVLVEKIKAWIEENPALANEAFGNGESALMRAIMSQNREIIDQLIQKGANINYINPYDGKTPIHVAVQHCQDSIINQILQEHPSLGIPDKEGNTPMHIYAMKGCTFEMLAALKGKDEELDTPGVDGNTVLHSAVKNRERNQELVKALLTAGLNPLQPNTAKDKQTALDIALTEGKENVSAMMAICEHLSPEIMANQPNLLRQLEPHRVEIIRIFKFELGAIDNKNPQSVEEAIARVDRIVNQNNGLGLLFSEKRKLPIPFASAAWKLGANLQKDNPLFKELIAIKVNLQSESWAKTQEVSRINSKKF